jgi:hypothetical protein
VCYASFMTDNEKFKNVDYSEYEPDVDEQDQINQIVGNKPWLLISAYSIKGGIGLNMQAGGGLSIELIEPMLEKALLAFRQGQQQSTWADPSGEASELGG